MNPITLHYSEPLLREAVRCFVIRMIWKEFGLRFFATCVLVTLCTTFLVARGDRSWIVGLLGGVLILVVTLLFIIYRAHFLNTVGRFRQMNNPEATFTGTEENFTVTSEFGSSTLPWSTIIEVLKYPRF